MILKKAAIITIMIIVIPVGNSYPDNVMKVKEIEFRGLVNLRKYEIIKRVDAKAGSDGITMNTDSLVRALKENPVIEGYSIINNRDRLIIKITERKPYATLAVKKVNRLVPFEVDENFRVISRDVIYSSVNPLIVIDSGDMNGGGLKEHVMRLCRELKDLERTNGYLYGQISEVFMNGSGPIDVRLNRRKTRFEITPDSSGFFRLGHMAGYLDGIKIHPEHVYFAGTVAVIKP